MSRQTVSSGTVERDKQFIWHPFTQMKDWLEGEPLAIASGEGVYLVDEEGRRYIDGVSSLWCNVHGHRRREIDEAVRDQLNKIAHSTFLGLTHGPAAELAEKLIAHAPPGLARVFFSDSGSEAVEVALKIAYQYWKLAGQDRRTFIKLENAYHGDTLGAVSVGGIDLFHEIFHPLLFETFSATSPYCYRCPLGLQRESCAVECLESMEKILADHAREVCAIVMEPVMQGAAGMIDQPPGYLKRVQELARRYDVLLIFDEVATGFGRTGTLFAAERDGVTPDLMALAKGITGGYLPLAATLATEEIFGAFLGAYAEKKAFFHGHTYTANPLACRAAIANLEIFERERTLERLAPKIAYLSKRLEAFRALDHVGDIRQAGFMVGIELARSKEAKEPYGWEERMGLRVCTRARSLGAILRPLGNVIVLMPPLSIDVPILGRLLDITFASILEETSAAGAQR